MEVVSHMVEFSRLSGRLKKRKTEGAQDAGRLPRRKALRGFALAWLVGGLLVLVGLAGCERNRPGPGVLAIVDGERIDEDAFTRSILLMPRYDVRRKGIPAIRQHLRSLIENKLLSEYAEELGLDRDPRIQKRKAWIRDNAMVEQLYREIVQKRVKVTDVELRQAFVKFNTQIHARHIFAKTENEAHEIYQALENGADWDSLAARVFGDSVLAANGGDLGWFTFGEMDPDFEAACYALPVGEISKPVRTRFGWHIIKVEDKKVNPILTEADFAKNYKKLERIVRSRKENAVANAYVKELMTPLRVTLKGRAFAFLVKRAQDVFGKPNRRRRFPKPVFKDEQVLGFAESLKPYRNEVLVEYRGGQWTIGDFLDRLEAMPPAERPRLNSPGSLRRGIKTMIRDAFLAKEARKRGLQNHPYVRSEVALWYEDTMAQLVKKQIADTIRVTEEEIQRAFEANPRRYGEPEKVKIREILVADSSLATDLLRRAKAGEDFGQLARKYSLRKWAAKRGGEFRYFARGSYGKLGEMAFQHRVGDWVGPVKVRGGYSIFQVTGHKDAFLPPMTDELHERVARDVKAGKFKKAYSELIRRLRAKSSIVVADSTFRRVAEEIGGDQFEFMLVRKIKD